MPGPIGAFNSVVARRTPSMPNTAAECTYGRRAMCVSNCSRTISGVATVPSGRVFHSAKSASAKSSSCTIRAV